jgi:DNA-binding transcriptional LysR family regulator
MNVRALQCFIKVYEKKSINAAAKEVFISPQGLSKVIKQLEIDLEADLFSRGTQGMEATESGELLYARAKHVCYLMEDIKKEISIINGSSSALNVVVTYSTAAAFPFDLLLTFSETNPNIRVKLREYSDEHNVADLFEEEADVGLIMGHEGLKNCNYELIMSGELVAVARNDHPLAAEKAIALEQLEDVDLVLKSVEEGKDHVFLDRCLERGLAPRVTYQSGNIATVHELCLKKGCVAVSVDFIERSFLPEGLRVIPLKERLPVNMYLITRNREIQSKAVSLFRKFIIDHAQKKRRGN